MRKIMIGLASAMLVAGVGCGGNGSSSSSGSTGSTGGTTSAGTTTGTTSSSTSTTTTGGSGSTGSSGSGSTGGSGSTSSSGSGSTGGSGSGSTGGVVLGGRTAVFSQSVVFIDEHDGGETVVPQDLSGSSLTGVVFFDDGGSASLPAVGLPDGGTSIPGLPDAGGYFFKWANSAYYNYTDRDAVDLSYAMPGRPDAQPLTQDTFLTLNLANLAPWTPNDFLEVTALGAGGAIDFGGDNLAYDDGGLAPFPSDTSLDGYTLDWAYATGVPSAISAPSGDLVFAAQLSSSSVGTTTFVQLDRFADLTGLSLADGQSAVVDGGFVTETPTTLFQATVIPPIGAANEIAGDGGIQVQTIADVEALPRVDTYGMYNGAVDLLYATDSSTTNSQTAFTAQYVDPYPAAWTLFGALNANFGYVATIPNAPPPGTTTITGGYFHMDTLANLGAAWSPTLTAPRNVKVNGQDATFDLTGLGTSPVVTWDAPATGTPTSYVVALRPVSSDGTSIFNNAIAFQAQVPASVHAVRIPDPLPDSSYAFSDASTYFYVTVAAIAQPTDITQTPFEYALPDDEATFVSHRLSP